MMRRYWVELGQDDHRELEKVVSEQQKMLAGGTEATRPFRRTLILLWSVILGLT